MPAALTDGLLLLEDGRTFRGRCFGAVSETGGEVVFNTAMTGYQEILTDPSYAGQIVVMTYPMIGNYGINPEDVESSRIYARGLVVKELSRVASNWRQHRSLDDALRERGVTGFCDLDTRALVRHLRDKGAMRGVIGPAEAGRDALERGLSDVPSMLGQDLASEVTCRERYPWSEGLVELGDAEADPALTAERHVVVYDFGAKRNILRLLVHHGARVTVVPASTSPEDVLALKPDGVMLSNGPGDPEPVSYAVGNIAALLGKVPMFGICLGHQLMGLAAGGKTYKLDFGHRGANHPVKNLRTGRVEVTSQNHGFCVDPDSLDPKRVELTHINLNDQTLAGFALRDVPAFGVQYHPEASPGPHDSRYLFEQFFEAMEAFDAPP